MAEIQTQVNIKEKISAVRSVVPNRRKNEIVLVLQQFDNNVDKAIQAFVDGSAVQVLKEWNVTGKKKSNKRKKSKSKQHPGSQEAQERAAGTAPDPPGSAGLRILPLHGCCGKDHPPAGPAGEKTEAGHPEQNPSSLPDSLRGHPKATEGGRAGQRKAPGGGTPKPTRAAHPNRPAARTPGLQPWTPGDPDGPEAEEAQKRGPNIEKSMKDLQRCTLSLARYRLMIKEEVDLSVKKIKAAFAELHVCITDKEKSLMAEMDKVKEEAMGILTARQKKAEELKRLTDLANLMAETQLSELRAEIKHFVSERKYDEELGRSARFSCDVEPLKAQISLCGEISHPKNNYSARAGCGWLLPAVGKAAGSRRGAAPSGPVLPPHHHEAAHDGGRDDGRDDGHATAGGRGPARPPHLGAEASPRAGSKVSPSGGPGRVGKKRGDHPGSPRGRGGGGRGGGSVSAASPTTVGSGVARWKEPGLGSQRSWVLIPGRHLCNFVPPLPPL
uniref:Spermatogenesis associated serine rich 2 like n=1 Tax=Ornithorhynchus anatinus TaxID=9258 RepID=A0A6I8P1D9_ORNAN